MKTIYELQQIANRLRQVTEVNSISPEDTFGLQSDILEYLADMEQNAEGLGIHKVYASYAAMVADASAPVGSNGKALRFGQLVVIYNSSNTTQAESGNVYAWQKGNTGAAAWLLMGNLGSVYALQSQIDSLLSALADEERARGNADSTLQGQITSLQTSLNTLMSGDVSIAIESFNEVIAFLDGIRDDETLTALLTAIQDRITALETLQKRADTALGDRIDSIVNMLDDDFPSVSYDEIDSVYPSADNPLFAGKDGREKLVYNVYSGTNKQARIGVLFLIGEQMGAYVTQILMVSGAYKDGGNIVFDDYMPAKVLVVSRSRQVKNESAEWSQWYYANFTALETLAQLINTAKKASDDAIHLLQYPLRLKVTGAPEGFVGVGESFAYTLSADRKDGTDETSEVAFGISVDGGTPKMLTKGLKGGIIKTEVGVHKIMFNALKGYENPEVEVSYTALPAFYAGLFAEADLVAVSTNLVTDTNKIQPNGYSANFAPDSTDAAYLWVAMPSSLKLDVVEMGDVSVPMEAGVSSGTMVYYRSSSQLDYKESFGEILFNFDF